MSPCLLQASKALQAATVAFSVVAMDHAYQVCLIVGGVCCADTKLCLVNLCLFLDTQINCLQSKKGYEVLEKVR